MYYTIEQTSDCELKVCGLWDSNGFINIPDIPGAVSVNYVDLHYTNACDENIAVIDERLLPLPIGLDVEILCQDDSGPRYTTIITLVSGPAVPTGSTYDWYFYYNTSLISAQLNSQSPTWYMVPEINKLVLIITLPNGTTITYERTPDSTTLNPDGCYDYIFNPAVITLNHPVYTINQDKCLLFSKPVDGIYTYKNTVNYNTSLLNNQEIEIESCNAVLCNTECDTVKYTSEHLCTDLYLMYQAILSSINCQRCIDACTIFEYLSKKLDNDKDCDCYDTDNCC
jgi:hypothetical protein